MWFTNPWRIRQGTPHTCVPQVLGCSSVSQSWTHPHIPCLKLIFPFARHMCRHLTCMCRHLHLLEVPVDTSRVCVDKNMSRDLSMRSVYFVVDTTWKGVDTKICRYLPVAKTLLWCRYHRFMYRQQPATLQEDDIENPFLGLDNMTYHLHLVYTFHRRGRCISLETWKWSDYESTIP